MTWWKQAAERWLAPVALLVVVGGCSGETPTATALPPVPVKPAPLPEMSLPPAPAIGLTPLPSAEEVLQAAPGGRADPFGRSGPVRLTGVMTVGHQQRALVTTAKGGGVICVGMDGRCGDHVPLVLPTGWSVLNIDVARGCIRLAVGGNPQDPLCIA